jgi:hypothetical protein
MEGNSISVVLEQYTPDEAALIVINHSIDVSEMVSGPGSLEIFDIHLPWDQVITIRDIATNPRAHSNSISAQIGAAPGPEVDLGPVRLDRIFGIPGVLAAKIILGGDGGSPDDAITIATRRRVYHLARSGEASQEWDIPALRQQINAADPWIEMPERGADVHDAGIDGALTPFKETRLTGGSGLPLTPELEHPLSGGAIIHVNYSEAGDGSPAGHNRVYQWVGPAHKGRWT